MAIYVSYQNHKKNPSSSTQDLLRGPAGRGLEGYKRESKQTLMSSQQDSLSKFRKCLSSPRLDAYKEKADDSEQIIIDRYFWNLDICEALYPALHIFEVTLRNEMNSSISSLLKDDNWLVNTNAFLNTNERTCITRAINSLHKKDVTQDRLVSMLSLGFWNALFTRAYEPSHNQVIWPALFKVKKADGSSFLQYCPKFKRNRSHIFSCLRDIRVLRNRIAHHEPVWKDKTKLVSNYNLIIDFLKWIDPELSKIVGKYCRFDETIIKNNVYRWDQIKSSFFDKNDPNFG